MRRGSRFTWGPPPEEDLDAAGVFQAKFKSFKRRQSNFTAETGPPITFMWGSSDHLPPPGKIVAKFSLQNGWEIIRAMDQLEPGNNIDELRARLSSAN
eukprot:4332986-Pyramimonas_sp.AAC.1